MQFVARDRVTTLFPTIGGAVVDTKSAPIATRLANWDRVMSKDAQLRVVVVVPPVNAVLVARFAADDQWRFDALLRARSEKFHRIAILMIEGPLGLILDLSGDVVAFDLADVAIVKINGARFRAGEFD